MPDTESGWKEVRRSVPPEHVSAVDDDALDYECWVQTDVVGQGINSLTIYSQSDPEQYTVIHHDQDNEFLQAGPFDTYEEAKEALEQAKEDIR